MNCVIIVIDNTVLGTTRSLLAMWRGMSPLQLTGPRYKRAYSWRGRPGIAGHLWFVGSQWQRRSRELYQAAADVAKALEE